MIKARTKMRRAGVLGGMGPDATLAFLEKFYALTRGRREQERPSLLVNIDPSVPDRNEAWHAHGTSPRAAIMRMGRRLKRAGADFCVMACVTAHGYVENFEQEVGVPLMRMPDVVAEALANNRSMWGSIGLLATSTTYEMGLFQKAFATRGDSLIVPDKGGQEALMKAIYAIKHGENALPNVLHVAQSLAARGARTLIIGCTDLSAIGPLHLEQCEVVDALNLLAKRTLDKIERR